jgi:hypothetical protein
MESRRSTEKSIRQSRRRSSPDYEEFDPTISSLSKRKFRRIVEEAKRSVRKQITAEKSRSKSQVNLRSSFTEDFREDHGPIMT